MPINCFSSHEIIIITRAAVTFQSTGDNPAVRIVSSELSEIVQSDTHFGLGREREREREKVGEGVCV